MAKGRIFQTEYPDNPPAWYWTNGLHDACIVGVESYEFPYDYGKYEGAKSQYARNMLTLNIDAKGAMFDFRVTEIRFYNVKILPESADLTSLELSSQKKIWWLADKLTEENGRYVLDILLEDVDSFPEQFHFKLRFNRAEVDR